ncbi:hypothetical protein ACC720_39170, partial [Rhizobium ruizarguesonis]
LGILMALGAAFFYALAALAAKWLKGTPPHLIALIQVATGMLILSPMTDFSHPPGDVMVIDAAKGIEPRTLKLFEVCRM